MTNVKNAIKTQMIFKRAFAIVIAFLLTAVLQIYAFADENGFEWSYDDETETLTVGGVIIPDFSEDNAAPWKDLRSQIKKIVIEEGIISIGSYAFSKCENYGYIYFCTLHVSENRKYRKWFGRDNAARVLQMLFFERSGFFRKSEKDRKYGFHGLQIA